jgi:GH15 family glucan-1,4-alpha-glucosidase
LTARAGTVLVSMRSGTDLPETPAGERNWDYRYTWIRDSTFLLRALHYLLFDWEADEFMQFIADLDRNDDVACRSCMGSTVAGI